MPLSLPYALTRRDGDVVLRDWREDDEAALEPLFAETDRRFSSLPARYSRGAALEHIERLRARREAGELLALAVTRRGVAPVGNVNLVFRFGAGTRQAALGYWMSPPARGQGLAAAAGKLLCDWGFSALSLTRIELLVEPVNVASHRVAERLGAVVDGRPDTRRTTAPRGRSSGTPCCRRPKMRRIPRRRIPTPTVSAGYRRADRPPTQLGVRLHQPARLAELRRPSLPTGRSLSRGRDHRSLAR
jgi:RimJ/RimL family protein N-acetyltransferase